MGSSFVHPCCVCTLTWQLSAKSSHGMPPYIVYTNFRMRSAMITFAPKHYVTALVMIDFSLSFGRTGPGYSMPSSASSAKHVGVKKTLTPIILTCSAHRILHWWSRGSYIDARWRRLVYRLMMPNALLPFLVCTYLSTLFGSIHSCSRKNSSNYPFTSPPKTLHFSFTIVLILPLVLIPLAFKSSKKQASHWVFWRFWSVAPYSYNQQIMATVLHFLLQVTSKRVWDHWGEKLGSSVLFAPACL